MQKLLLVDDEQNVLNALRRELKDLFEVETFTDPVAALEQAGKTGYDLVIADYRMPGLNGLEFLRSFRQVQPDACCLLLSGEADINALIRTINETHVYRFIAKPWEKAELVANIRQALAHRNVILERRRTASPTVQQQDGATFHIVLVEGDEHLLAVISHGLTEENGQENLYAVIQQELGVATPRKFQCRVDGFCNGREALAHVAGQPCDLVIAAQRLPDMTGIELLRQMRQLRPDAGRILISNEADREVLSKAVNEAEVQSLLQLYWANYELRADARRQVWNLHQLKTAVIQALIGRVPGIAPGC